MVAAHKDSIYLLQNREGKAVPGTTALNNHEINHEYAILSTSTIICHNYD